MGNSIGDNNNNTSTNINNTSSMNSNTQNNNSVRDGSRQPDSDAIKMFVGQLPKHWNEHEAREIFTEFGDIHTLNILRDRETNVSRGCCFVTYYVRESAIIAKRALHNTKVLPGM